MKKQTPTTAFAVVRRIGLHLPEVEVTTNWAGAPVLNVRGCLIADQHPIARLNLARSSSAVLYMKRELFLDDAPDT
jgi:hypothetical protein